ncbi:MAG: carboxypeptidase regulatory-like domain-containing protein [Desulfomonilia bacterium]|nr:carboxypeptidase regulatory-like domain-containing protein [Desulfomonilia bacterium]
MNNTSKDVSCAPGVRRSVVNASVGFIWFVVFCLLVSSGASAQETVSMADAGEDVAVVKNLPLGSSLVLHGSATPPGPGKVLEYSWYGPFGNMHGASPLVTIPEGDYTVSLIVDCGSGFSEPDTAVVSVVPCFPLVARAKNDKVQLSWTHLEGTERYDVYRAHEADPFTFEKIGETTSSYASYLDYPPENEYTYLYLVGALGQGGWCYSQVSSAHPTAVRTRSLVNYDPRIYSPPITRAFAGIVYTYDVNATDPNADSITYLLVDAPGGMDIDPEDGRISWVPETSGDYGCVVGISDGRGGADTQVFTITVEALSQSPPLVFRPTAEIAVHPEPITRGSSSMLVWNSSNADTVIIEPGVGNVDANGEGSTVVCPDATTTYSILATGPGGSASDEATLIVLPVPIVSITAEPPVIIEGESSLLIWESHDADPVVIDQDIGVVAPQGSMVVSPQQSTTYTITGAGPDCIVADQATLTVLHPPSVQMIAEPGSIVSGQQARLSWESHHADSLVIDQGIGSVDPSGHTLVSPEITTTYTITAKGPGGSASGSATVAVCQVPTVTLDALPEEVIAGQGAVLRWSSINAITGIIDHGIGEVLPNGSVQVWPQETTRYTISVSGEGGVAEDSTDIVVIQVPAVTLSAHPNPIIAGETSTLSWESEHADKAIFDQGIGEVACTGSHEVAPGSSTTYSISVQGPGGSAADSVCIDVLVPPRVGISAQPNPIVSGEATFLSWTSEHADTVVLDQALGEVGLEGSLLVSPTETTTYTATATGPGGAASDSVIVVVDEPLQQGSAHAYITNNISNDVSVIDLSTRTVVDRITVGFEPYGVAVSPDGRRVYVSSWDNTVSVIDTATRSVIASLDVDALCLAVSRDGSVLYVVSLQDSVVRKFSTSDFTPMGSVSVGRGAHGIAISPDDSKVYVACSDDASVDVIDSASMTVVDSIELVFWATPLDIEITPDGTKAYVTSGNDGTVKVIDAQNHTLLHDIEIFRIPEISPFPMYLVISHDGSRAYVTCQDGNIVVIDTATDTVERLIPVGYGMSDLCLDPGGETLYVPELFEDAVYLIDAATGDTVHVVGGDFDMPFTCGSFIAVSSSRISGRVLSGGEPCAGVRVFLSDGSMQRITLTDAQGVYMFHVPAGEYVITAEKQGYAFTPQEVAVSASGGDAHAPDMEVLVSVAISAEPPAIDLGMSTLLSWTTYNASQAIIDRGIGDVGPAGDLEIWPTETSHYTIVATHPTGVSVSASTAVVVIQPPDVVFSIAPETIVRGDSALLEWTSAHAQSLSMDQGIGSVPLNGSLAVYPEASLTYSITATGPGGTVTSSAAVTVIEKPAVTISADPPEISLGGGAVLSWSSSAADSVVIDQDLGQVEPSGSLWVHPDATTTYTVTAAGPGGTINCSAVVTVFEPPVVEISAQPSTIDAGETSLLSWTCTDARLARIDPSVGSVPTCGNTEVSPGTSTTYTLTAQGPGGTTQASVTLDVVEPLITITSPVEGSAIWRPDTMVTGRIRHSLCGEFGVTVNGIPALVFGNSFVVNHVPLTTGQNTISALLSSSGGEAGEASVTIQAGVTRPYITLDTLESSGTPVFQTRLKVESLFPDGLLSITDSGPGPVVYAQEDGDTCDVTMEQEGIYFITAHVIDGEVYTDTIGVVVLNAFDIDELIQAKWRAMKEHLDRAEIAGAMECFSPRSRQMFEQNFTLMQEHLPDIVASMGDIRMVGVSDGVAEYEMWAEQGGESSSFLVRFIMDSDGLWKIDFF